MTTKRDYSTPINFTLTDDINRSLTLDRYALDLIIDSIDIIIDDCDDRDHDLDATERDRSRRDRSTATELRDFITARFDAIDATA